MLLCYVITVFSLGGGAFNNSGVAIVSLPCVGTLGVFDILDRKKRHIAKATPNATTNTTPATSHIMLFSVLAVVGCAGGGTREGVGAVVGSGNGGGLGEWASGGTVGG